MSEEKPDKKGKPEPSGGTGEMIRKLSTDNLLRGYFNIFMGVSQVIERGEVTTIINPLSGEKITMSRLEGERR